VVAFATAASVCYAPVIMQCDEGITVTGQLPPSKFGRGFTYGGPDQTQSPPQPVPPSAYPSAPPTQPVDPPPAFAGFGGTAPPAPQPFQYPQMPPPPGTPPLATPPDPAAPPPFVNPYGTGQPATLAWNPAPVQSGYPSGGSASAFLNSGDGAPKTAAVLSIIGGLWALFTVIQRGEQIKYLFKFSKYASHLPTGSGYYYLTMFATVAEIAAVPLLLAAGYLLWQRHPNSIKAVLTANGVVIAANLILAVAVNKATRALTYAVNSVTNGIDDIATKIGIHSSRFNSITTEYGSALDNKISSLSSEFIAIHLVLPAILAFVALVLARSVATKLWVRSQTGYGP